LAAGASYGAIQLRARTRIDDSLDVFACHGVAGIVGAILTGVFATTTINAGGADGLLYGGPGLVVTQAIAVFATMIFAGFMTFGILKLVSLVMPIRVPVNAELGGLDLSEHGEAALHSDELGGHGLRPSLGEGVILMNAPHETGPKLTVGSAR
jgi:Amt family ammonium transporter